MEIITAVIGLCSGFLLGWGVRRPRASQAPKEPELPEIPKRLKIQMDNFMTYDGTARERGGPRPPMPRWGMGLLRPRASQAPREPELPEIPRRLKIQMDNFMTYDGTARGQKPIEE